MEHSANYDAGGEGMRVKVTSRGGGMEYYGHNDGWDTGILEDGKPVIGFSDYPARRPGTVQKWWIVWQVVIHPETNFRFYDKTTQTYSFWKRQGDLNSSFGDRTLPEIAPVPNWIRAASCQHSSFDRKRARRLAGQNGQLRV